MSRTNHSEPSSESEPLSEHRSADSPTESNDPADSNPLVYPSAIDRWIGISLLLGPAIAGAIGIYAMWSGRHGEAVIVFLVGAFCGLITVLLVLPCRYTLHRDMLSARCGILVWRVDLNDIVAAEPSRSLLSGPALSLRRIAVRTDRRTLLVSPRDQKAFLQELGRRMRRVGNPHADAVSQS